MGAGATVIRCSARSPPLAPCCGLPQISDFNLPEYDQTSQLLVPAFPETGLISTISTVVSSARASKLLFYVLYALAFNCLATIVPNRVSLAVRILIITEC